MEKSKNITDKVITIIIVILFLMIWEFSVKFDYIDPFFISRPSLVIKDIIHVLKTGEILPHIGITMYESVLGLIIGSLIGIIMAFILGRFERLANILDPIIMGAYSIPKLALSPLFILWFGLGIESKVFLSAITVLFVVLFNTYEGYKTVDKDLINLVRSMNATELQIMTKVIIPSCIPWIAASIKSGLGLAIIGALIGEYMGSNKGLGWMIQNSGAMLNITRVLTCITYLMVIMSFLNMILKLVESKVLRWRINNN